MATPESFYREAIDLNRYSNQVARRIITNYNNVILDLTNKLATMQTELWKEIGLKVEKIKSLEETIADKEETIEYYSDQNSELIGRVNEVEDELKACKGTETSSAKT